MNWITRCPACGVTYQLMSEPLKVAQGWLRCGQCQEAFDSTGLVLAWPVDAATSEPTRVCESAAARLDIADLLTQEDRSTLQSPVAAFEEALATFQPLPWLPTPTALAPVVLDVSLGGLTAHDTAPEARSPAVSPAASSAWPMVFVCGLLLALAVQWVVAGRHLLSTAEPALAQPLQTFCRLFGCEMRPPPVRHGVVIENSSMTPRDDGIALLWTVRNVTQQALEMPALELTWLDAQDKVLVRRVLLPTEQVAPSALAAGQIWQGQLQLLPVEGLQPVGYRLVSFYH
jgi:hypothetical protein